MLKPRQVLHAKQPDLRDARGERRLLVWGDLAQWMVVNGELERFLGLFNGYRSLKNVLRAHAKATQRPLADVERDALPTIEALVARGVLSERKAGVGLGTEPLSIANVTVNLTNRCNLRCRWCYNAGRTTDEMPVEAMMDAVARGRDVLEKDATFIVLGGEPLLDLGRLRVALDRAGALFTSPACVSTNGTLLTPQAVETLAERRVDVQVSLDSPCAARHDAERGPGVFDKAVEGVRRLVEAGAYTILSMVYTRENYTEFEPYLDMALELGVNEARFIPMRMIGLGVDYRDLAPDQTRTFRHLMEILDRRPELGPLLRRDFFSILVTVCRYTASRTCCGIARRVIFIDADGKVYPCPNHTQADHVCGDLHEQHLADIFRNSPVLRAFREQYQVSRYTRCRTCPFRHWCAGDCRGEVLALTGDPLAPSPHCGELRETILEILWLIADGDERLGTVRTDSKGRRAEDAFLT